MRTVLLLEDDKLLSKSLQTVLRSNNYQVVVVMNSAEYKKEIARHNFDIILLDIMIPGDMDGFAILQELRQDPKYQSTPIVMLTNLGQVAEIDRAMELGASDYVVKANTDLLEIVNIVNKQFN